MKLENKLAIVTGGAAGIGKAIALALAREGADVAIADIQDEKARAVAQTVEAQGRRALAIHCDVSNSTEVNAMVAQVVSTWSGLDILVNNAAVIAPGLFWQLSDEDWHRIIRTNLNSVFFCSRAAAQVMIGQGRGGRIISMSSIHATLSEPSAGPYTAAKGGIEAFSRTMATELAPYRILVNCVAPGATYSELTTPMYTEPVKRSLFERVPLREIAQPEWIAAGVVFLASDDARYMTGQVLTIDGGYVMDGSLPGAKYWTE